MQIASPLTSDTMANTTPQRSIENRFISANLPINQHKHNITITRHVCQLKSKQRNATPEHNPYLHAGNALYFREITNITAAALHVRPHNNTEFQIIRRTLVYSIKYKCNVILFAVQAGYSPHTGTTTKQYTASSGMMGKPLER